MQDPNQIIKLIDDAIAHIKTAHELVQTSQEKTIAIETPNTQYQVGYLQIAGQLTQMTAIAFARAQELKLKLQETERYGMEAEMPLFNPIDVN